MTPVKLLMFIAGWLVVFLFILTEVGEPLCETPSIMTVGDAAKVTFTMLVFWTLGFIAAKTLDD